MSASPLPGMVRSAIQLARHIHCAFRFLLGIIDIDSLLDTAAAARWVSACACDVRCDTICIRTGRSQLANTGP